MASISLNFHSLILPIIVDSDGNDGDEEDGANADDVNTKK